MNNLVDWYISQAKENKKKKKETSHWLPFNIKKGNRWDSEILRY